MGTRLNDISERLLEQYRKQFGNQNVETIRKVAPELKTANKLYLHISTVDPYLDSKELSERSTPFERTFNLCMLFFFFFFFFFFRLPPLPPCFSPFAVSHDILFQHVSYLKHRSQSLARPTAITLQSSTRRRLFSSLTLPSRSLFLVYSFAPRKKSS